MFCQIELTSLSEITLTRFCSLSPLNYLYNVRVSPCMYILGCKPNPTLNDTQSRLNTYWHVFLASPMQTR